ncbi:helix-turn-helix domain-containing protein [Jiella sp. MQZ9-1]|uniref:Helix-turn-helix transcriptional regulator n=1 Tax=Jiella flava TaxID=2816857 RepID=A0A939FZR7_9HYPH|nr:helix-turn-helix transcriptional regulator [Jiella flava]MBO0662983.1 helix-turn-helix transcriptional regulator [Jiella flava]MCD2471257.1 helix-turn-helix domain-containing protein [Jiella flava]
MGMKPMSAQDQNQIELDVAVGRRLRDLRMAAGLTQADLAHYLQGTVHQIERYERGKARIGVDRLSDLAERFNVSILVFFEGVDAIVEPAACPASDWLRDLKAPPPPREARIRKVVNAIMQRAVGRRAD